MTSPDKYPSSIANGLDRIRGRVDQQRVEIPTSSGHTHQPQELLPHAEGEVLKNTITEINEALSRGKIKGEDKTKLLDARDKFSEAVGGFGKSQQDPSAHEGEPRSLTVSDIRGINEAGKGLSSSGFKTLPY